MPRLGMTAAACRALSGLLIATTVLACSGGAPSASTASGGAGGSLEATTGGGPAVSQAPSSELCALFTPAELTTFLGAQVASGSVGGPLDSSCEWDVGESFLMIQKVPVDYFEDHRGAAGYRELDEVGDYAFVAAHPFGRITTARTTDAAYVVIASDTTDEAGQIEILRRFIERSPGTPVLDPPDLPSETVAPAATGAGSAADCAVSTDAVSEATGIEMVQTDGCSWAASDPGTLYEVVLTNVPMTLFEYLRGQEVVDGLGDEAYFDGALFVRVGDRAASISVVTLSLDTPEVRDVAIAIASHVVEGLR